jgi:hypothetical protein
MTTYWKNIPGTALSAKLRRRSLAFNSFFICLLLSFSFSLSASSWHVKYKEGRKAMEKQRWEQAITCFKEAIDDRKEPKLNARTVALNFIDYLPYYYLGKACYNFGAFKDSQNALQESLKWDEISKKPDLLSELQKMLEDCKIKLKSESSLTETEADFSSRIAKHIANGERYFKKNEWNAASREFHSARLLIRQKGEPPQGPKLKDVESRLQDVARAKKRYEDLRRAQAMANKKQYPQAVSILSSLLHKYPKFKEAEKLLKRIRKQQNTLTAPGSATDNDNKIDDFNSTELSINDLLDRGRKLLKDGKVETARLAFSRILARVPGHRQARAELNQIENSPEIALNDGIRKYFNGEHAASEAYLRTAIKAFLHQTESHGQRKKLIRAFQFLAIVLIERHFLEADPSKEMFKEAGNYISRILDLEPQFSLDSRYFSPKVIEAFERLKKK